MVLAIYQGNAVLPCSGAPPPLQQTGRALSSAPAPLKARAACFHLLSCSPSSWHTFTLQDYPSFGSMNIAPEVTTNWTHRYCMFSYQIHTTQGGNGQTYTKCAK
eukprot:293267-Chlamydomonas_euryale.AAC.3